MKRRNTGRELDYEEFAKLHAFQYRLSELLVTCEVVSVAMSDDFVFCVWGVLRHGPEKEPSLLASVPGDLDKAIELAMFAAQELERPYLETVKLETTS